MGLKRSTATPEGLGGLFALMGARPDLYATYDDPQAAFSRQGREAGDAALSRMFGSPDASRAIADQAQQLSGVSSTILKKLLPVLAGLVISGLMRSGSGQAAPSAPQPSPAPSGGLGDILRQIFPQATPDASGPAANPVPSAPRTAPEQGGSLGDKIGPGAGYRVPTPGDQPNPVPTDAGGQTTPGGDVLAQIMRELAKAIEEGRLKPIVVGPFEIDVPGQAGPAGSGQPQQAPGGDILGQILREVLGGTGGVQLPRQALMGGVGAAVFGDRLEAGHSVEQSHLDGLQDVLNRFVG